MRYHIYSWNVNGIRATVKRGFVKWLKTEKPDILCLQETKASEDQIPPEIKNLRNFSYTMILGERKGYSGVGNIYRVGYDPISEENSIGKEEFDKEGRVVISEYPEFTLFNVYFPNGKKDQERLDYKMRFYEHFLDLIVKLKEKGKSIIVCGDVNTAHTENDLFHHKSNSNVSGFLPIEREWMDRLISAGFIDTLRHIHGDKEHMYTWWSIRKPETRMKNVGWRIDYFYISEDLVPNLKDAMIHADVMGSDHCPISISLEFS